MTEESDANLASSTGQAFTEAAHLDKHYLVCQPEYEAMLRSVGLKSSWQVLDAGCGMGSFLPLMSQLLGPSGRIEALDLASENVEIIQAQQASGAFSCTVNAQVGSVTKLPYEDGSFDAVWCAAVTQYLTDNELETMLNEFKRVLKPNGLLAIKDFVPLCWQFQPLDPLLLPRLWQAQVEDDNAYTKQALRISELPVWIRKAGFKVEKIETFMAERCQPLREVEKAFFAGPIRFLASVALNNERLSTEDCAVWQKLANVDADEHILNHPDFYTSEGHLLVLARKPSS